MKILKAGTAECAEALQALADRKLQILADYGVLIDEALTRYAEKRDDALIEWAREYDEVQLKDSELWVDESHIKNAHKHVESDLRKAIDHTIERIQGFQEELKVSSFSSQSEAGLNWGMEVRPLDRVGIYVPGSRANYFIALLLAAIPARAAGVKEIIVATPPKARLGVPHVEPTLLYAAKMLQISKILVSGGVGAMAALALGTKDEAPVQKVVGSGSRRTMAAKMRISAFSGTDFLSGPSETAFICDRSTSVEAVSADMIGRADRDPEAELYVFHSDSAWLEKLIDELAKGMSLLRDENSRTGVKQCLDRKTKFFLVKNVEAGIALANQIAPGVVALMVDQPSRYVPSISACGSLLLGHFTPSVSLELAGGPGGLVPTLGSAQYSLSMSPASFMRRFPVLEMDESALGRLELQSVALSTGEGFMTHEASYRKRLD